MLSQPLLVKSTVVLGMLVKANALQFYLHLLQLIQQILSYFRRSALHSELHVLV